MTVGATCGVMAGVVSAVDAAPYVRDILRGTTRPHRGTWAIWTVLAATAFAAQAADGASWTLWMLGVQAASVVTVFLLSIPYGTGGVATVDLAVIAVAAAGVLGWYVSANPVVATACVLVADLAGVALMVSKVWRDPGSETVSSFVMAAVAGGLGTAAVGALDPSLLLYPAYFALVNAGTAAFILMRLRISTRDNDDRALLHEAM